MIYVADSESGPDNPGMAQGVPHRQRARRRAGGLHRDPEGTTPDHSGAEGVGVDAQGNVYGAVVRRHGLDRWVRGGR